MQKTEQEFKAKSITLPVEIVAKLEEEARKNKRSFSGEIAYRMEKSLEREKTLV